MEVDATVQRLDALKSRVPPSELAWRERIAKLELSDFSGFSPTQVLGESALREVANKSDHPHQVGEAKHTVTVKSGRSN